MMLPPPRGSSKSEPQSPEIAREQEDADHTVFQAAESLLATSTGKDALEHAIQAAELYMQAAGNESVTKAEAIRLRRKCKELIAYAERLKTQLRKPPLSALSFHGPTLASSPSPSPSPSTAPHGPSLSETELSILDAASHLHGNKYPIWQSQPSDAEFYPGPHGEAFVDDTSFTLSTTQRVHFASWSRPEELFDADSHQDEFMCLKGPCDLVQDVTTDCSVVASLSAAATVLTGRHSVLSTIIFPFDHEKQQPKLSPSGKYVLRMNFNGCYRRVFIDDRLPRSRTNRALFVIDRQNPRLIWPALLEKAYLKVRGGYDFPGSNSGTDLWVLTGWIPEQIFLQREDFDVDETWARVETAYDLQNVVVTLGTGRVSKEEEESMGLAGHHDYAVQDMRISEGVRELLIKNPWYDDLDHATALPAVSGAFWMTIEEVTQHFESMYLNWNPASFSYRQNRHFEWCIPPKVFHACLARNPQFSLRCHGGGMVWILLSRHFKDAELAIAHKRSEGRMTADCQLGFMNLSVYESDGKRVQMTDGQIYCGPYVDSPQTLARFCASSGRPYTIVVDQQELPLERYTFTLSIFSSHSVELKDAEQKMPHSLETFGSWNRRTAGGNPSCSTYFLNPQFKLSVTRRSPISILLSADNSDIHVHVDLVWNRGERASTVRARDLVASSGEYRRGGAVADIPELDAGTYTLVCSTFEEGQTAAFVLQVASAVPITLDRVPAAAAGRLRKALPQFLSQGGSQRRRAMLDVSSLTRMSISAHALAPRSEARSRSSLMIRLTVLQGRGPEQVTLARSGDGEFQDSTTAILTPEFDVEPARAQRGRLWLVLEVRGADHPATTIDAEVFSDSPVQVGVWEEH